MFKSLRIKIFGHQPAAKVTDKMLDELLKREFGKSADLVRQKLNAVVSDTHLGKNRISAAIIRLSNKDINAIDNYIRVASNDSRDLLAQAEYSRCSKIGLDDLDQDMKAIYLADWKEYSDWLKR